MNIRSVAFGAALTIGGLVGVDSASQEALEVPESSSVPTCENALGSDPCSSLGKPIEAYVAIVTKRNTADYNEAGTDNDILRVKLSAIASGAGSLILLCAACQHVIESWPTQTRRVVS